MKVINRLSPEVKKRNTHIITYQGEKYAITYNPKNGEGMFDTKEQAENEANIYKSYDNRHRVIVFDKMYYCYMSAGKV